MYVYIHIYIYIYISTHNTYIYIYYVCIYRERDTYSAISSPRRRVEKRSASRIVIVASRVPSTIYHKDTILCYVRLYYSIVHIEGSPRGKRAANYIVLYHYIIEYCIVYIRSFILY